MKTIITKVGVLVLTVLIFSGCKKYEEGPSLSLRSKKARVANNWTINYAEDLENGEDITSDFSGESWEFTKAGEFVEYNDGVIDKVGTWEFVVDMEALSITKPSGNGTDTDIYTILKLKENDMWITDGDEELHLIPVE